MSGFVTVEVGVFRTGLEHLKLAVKHVHPYYSEFLSAFSIVESLERYIESGDFMADEEYEERSPKTFLLFPRLDNVKFPENMTFRDICVKCRKQGICYDFEKKSGTLLFSSDKINESSLGMLVIDSNFS